MNDFARDANTFTSSRMLSKDLDKEPVEFGDIRMKPSQCYTFSLNPPHVLFNTNCPDSLREKVPAILLKYFKEWEVRTE
jgi:hypothetical protein